MCFLHLSTETEYQPVPRDSKNPHRYERLSYERSHKYSGFLVWIIELSPTEEKYRKNPFCRSAISPIRSLPLASQVNMYGNNSFVGRIAGMILRPYIPGCSADSSARRR